MLTINLPYSKWEYKISGIYKITFSDGSFYIGSSVHLRSRASAWDSCLRTGDTGDLVIGAAMINKIKEGLPASLDIIELCSPDDVRDREGYYLFENKDNPLMLSNWYSGAWKPVIQYNTDGLFIKKHMSISEAARYIGSTIGRVQDVLNGLRKSHKGMVFIYEKDYMDRRSRIIKSRYIVKQKKNGRDVIKCDKNGNEIERYKKIIEAARSNNISVTCVSDALNGRQRTSKGFIFKYA